MQDDIEANHQESTIFHFELFTETLKDPFKEPVARGVSDVQNALPHGFWQTLKADWHNDIILMVEDRLPKFLIILFCLVLIERLVHLFVKRMQRIAAHESMDPHHAAQLRTMTTILRATVFSFLGFIIFLQFLKLMNINIGPILASAGILGVGIGLGAQSLFKDIINGIFIILEDQFNVGETVKLASLTGTVEDLTLRLTRLRDNDGTLYIIPNSQIATVQNLSRDFAVATLAVSVDASAEPSLVLSTLQQIATTLHSETTFRDAILGEPGVSGIDSISGRTLSYTITAKVRIAQKDDVLRAFRNRIIEAFKSRRIPLGADPANMLLIAQQQGATPDPTAPPSQQPIVHS